MIDSYKVTVRRKTNAINAVHECWPGSPELLELVAAKGGLGKWMGFASLARATDGAPEVAKYCLNKALLARVRRRKTGHGGTNLFTGPNFIEERRMAANTD